MWEIDTLLIKSIEFVKDSKLDIEQQKHIVSSLENIPELYGFDAGGFEKSEQDPDFDYIKMNPYQLGDLIMQETKKNKNHLIYDWSAFLLNFWNEYFSNLYEIEALKSNYLNEMKIIFNQYTFDDYDPIHASLTIYEDGNKWFSEEQNTLIKWYCS